MHTETFPFALLAMMGVFLGAGGLVACSLSSAVFHGLRRAWPLLLSAGVYAMAFLVVPPVPLQKVFAGGGLTLWDAIRYGAIGIGFALVARDYFKALCRVEQLERSRA